MGEQRPEMHDPKTLMEVLSAVHTNPGADVSAATGRYTRPEAMVGEVNDDGQPPAFIGVSHRDFPFDFEAVLGFYDPDERRITCFSQGIRFVAEALNVHPDLVERIVRYHEYAHSLHHLGITKTNITPEKANTLLRINDLSYREAPKETKEQIAQLTTLVVIRTRHQATSTTPEAQKIFDRMLQAFFMLMQRQSDVYRLPPSLRELDLSRLQKKLRLLLEMSDGRMFPSVDQIERIID